MKTKTFLGKTKQFTAIDAIFLGMQAKYSDTVAALS